jgi:ribose transport system substrate-binding protein
MTLMLPFRLLVISLATIFLLSCTPTPEPAPRVSNAAAIRDVETDVVQVALVMKTLTNPFFVQMEAGARRAEKEFGIELLVKTAAQETSIQQQIDIVERLIDDKVDAIVISPGDSIELIPALARAQKAGIAVVNIDNKLDAQFAKRNGMKPIPFISVDNETSAYEVTKYLTAKISKPTQAVVIEGIEEAQNSQDRKNGALRAFAESNRVDVVMTKSAHWKIDEAYTVVTDMFEQYPSIGAIFCANDMMALGVLEFLSQTERSDVLVASYDALEDAKRAVLSGELVATVDQKPEEQGYLGVRTALNLLKGEPVEDVLLIDAELVTKETLTR